MSSGSSLRSWQLLKTAHRNLAGSRLHLAASACRPTASRLAADETQSIFIWTAFCTAWWTIPLHCFAQTSPDLFLNQGREQKNQSLFANLQAVCGTWQRLCVGQQLLGCGSTWPRASRPTQRSIQTPTAAQPLPQGEPFHTCTLMGWTI